MSKESTGFFLTVICLTDPGPFRPWIGCQAFIRKFRHHSIWVTEVQPWRMQVPTQSFPVSPPPTMTTFSLWQRWEMSDPSDVWWRQSGSPRRNKSLLPGGFHRPDPAAFWSRSKGQRHHNLSGFFCVYIFPTSAFVTKRIPSVSIRERRRSTMDLSSFIFGMPYIRSPPGRSSRSNTVT